MRPERWGPWGAAGSGAIGSEKLQWADPSGHRAGLKEGFPAGAKGPLASRVIQSLRWRLAEKGSLVTARAIGLVGRGSQPEGRVSA